MAHFGTWRQPRCAWPPALAVDRGGHRRGAGRGQVNDNAMEAMDAIIRRVQLPAHTVGFGVRVR